MHKLLHLFLVLVCTTNALAQSVKYEIYALRFTSPRSMPLSLQVIDAPEKEMYSGVFMFWLLRGDNGKKMLVDAGFLKDSEIAKTRELPGYVRPDSVLLRLGIKAEEITDVIVSHPHWDHVDGVDLYKNARVWIQKEDYEYFVGTAWQPNGNREGFEKRDVTKLVDLNLGGSLMLIDGDGKEILPGIKVYTGSRHTFNSQYVLVTSGADKVIIASDNAKIFYNIERLKSVPKNATFDTNAYVKGIERMKTLVSDPKLIIPGHDALLFSRFPLVADGIARIR